MGLLAPSKPVLVFGKLHVANDPKSAAEYFVHSLDVEEGFSQLYTIRVVLGPTGGRQLPEIPLFDTWMGSEVGVELLGEVKQYFHGVVTGFEVDDSGALVLTLRPALAVAENTVRSRTFLKQTIRQVVEAVLNEHGVKFKYAARSKLGTLRYRQITQYEESDAAFALRLLAEAGLFFDFRHTASGHVMHILDDSRVLAPIGPVRQYLLIPSGLVKNTQPTFYRWKVRRRFKPGKYEIRTASAKQPGKYTLSKASSRTASRGELVCKRYEVMPSEVCVDRDDLPDMAESMIRSPDLERSVAEAGGTVRLRPGDVFAAPGSGITFMVIQVRHAAQEGHEGKSPGYFNAITAIPATVSFVPPHLPRPKITGHHYAVVVAADGKTKPEGGIDLIDGRVWVRFDWDLAKKPRVPVPLSPDWPDSYGPPRIGRRVVVGFRNGNPDQPLILKNAPAAKAKLAHDTNKHPNAYTVRLTPAAAGGTKDDHIVVQADATSGKGDVAVQAPGGFFVRARKLLSFFSLANVFVRSDATIVAQAKKEIILEADTKITIKVGGSVIVLSKEGITIDGKMLYLCSSGGPAASSAPEPEQDGKIP